jgi:hypothetical protein
MLKWAGCIGFPGYYRELGAVIPGVYGDNVTQQALLDENGNKIPNQTLIELNDLYFRVKLWIQCAG